ncbi:hypothetical protein RSG06_002210 [Yersinia enterocolitica]|nr:hypothetical protein [Yersinia enterocolitica]
MDITKSREAFEAYIRKNFQYPTLEMEPEDDPCAGEYVDTMREEQFQLWDAAWKASRAGIEVELPTQDEYDDPLSAYNAISDCKKILHDAGIRIKGESE